MVAKKYLQYGNVKKRLHSTSHTQRICDVPIIPVPAKTK